MCLNTKDLFVDSRVNNRRLYELYIMVQAALPFLEFKISAVRFCYSDVRSEVFIKNGEYRT